MWSYEGLCCLHNFLTLILSQKGRLVTYPQSDCAPLARYMVQSLKGIYLCESLSFLECWFMSNVTRD